MLKRASSILIERFNTCLGCFADHLKLPLVFFPTSMLIAFTMRPFNVYPLLCLEVLYLAFCSHLLARLLPDNQRNSPAMTPFFPRDYSLPSSYAALHCTMTLHHLYNIPDSSSNLFWSQACTCLPAHSQTHFSSLH